MTLLESSRYPADTVRLKAEEWQGYQKRFPQLVEKKIPLAIDEYAYFNFSRQRRAHSAAKISSRLSPMG